LRRTLKQSNSCSRHWQLPRNDLKVSAMNGAIKKALIFAAVGEAAFAVLDPSPAQVFPVDIDEVERTEHRAGSVAIATDRAEDGQTGRVAHDGFAVDHARIHRQRRDRTNSIRPHGVGRSGRIPNSSTTTGSTRADTSLLGSSRNSFQKRFAQDSDHSAMRVEDFGVRALRTPTLSPSFNVKLICQST